MHGVPHKIERGQKNIQAKSPRGPIRRGHIRGGSGFIESKCKSATLSSRTPNFFSSQGAERFYCPSCKAQVDSTRKLSVYRWPESRVLSSPLSEGSATDCWGVSGTHLGDFSLPPTDSSTRYSRIDEFTLDA